MKVSTDHWSLSLIPLLLIVRNGMSFVFPRNQFPSSSSSVSFIQRRKISTISPTYQGITSTTVQSSTDNNDSTSSETNQQIPKKEPLKPIILDPFPEAANPTYPVRGPVGEGGFMISRTGGPTEQELTDENLYKIIDRVASDLEVNTLVWKCLGYRFDPDKEEWTTAEVFPKWKERYPTPPDVIGMQRIYSKDVDGPCLRNNQALVRSIPVENKQSYLKQYMKPFGFTGYKVRFFLVAFFV